MKKCKMLLIILASLVLAGCNGSKIVDERGETESVTAAEKTTTDKDPDAAVEAEFYDNESSEETLRYCVEQDLEDAGLNVIDV